MGDDSKPWRAWNRSRNGCGFGLSASAVPHIRVSEPRSWQHSTVNGCLDNTKCGPPCRYVSASAHMHCHWSWHRGCSGDSVSCWISSFVEVFVFIVMD